MCRLLWGSVRSLNLQQALWPTMPKLGVLSPVPTPKYGVCRVSTSTPQLPFKIPQIPSKRDYKGGIRSFSQSFNQEWHAGVTVHDQEKCDQQSSPLRPRTSWNLSANSRERLLKSEVLSPKANNTIIYIYTHTYTYVCMYMHMYVYLYLFI